MIQIRVVDDIAGITDALERFRRSLDLYEVAKDIREVIYKDNVDARLAGVDKNGRRLDDLRPATLERRSGSSTPLVPHGTASRAIADFDVRVERLAEGDFEVTGWWEMFPQLAYHIDGFTHTSGYRVPARDITGIRPGALVEIEELFDAWATRASETLS